MCVRWPEPNRATIFCCWVSKASAEVSVEVYVPYFAPASSLSKLSLDFTLATVPFCMLFEGKGPVKSHPKVGCIWDILERELAQEDAKFSWQLLRCGDRILWRQSWAALVLNAKFCSTGPSVILVELFSRRLYLGSLVLPGEANDPTSRLQLKTQGTHSKNPCHIPKAGEENKTLVLTHNAVRMILPQIFHLVSLTTKYRLSYFLLKYIQNLCFLTFTRTKEYNQSFFFSFFLITHVSIIVLRKECEYFSHLWLWQPIWRFHTLYERFTADLPFLQLPKLD